MSMDPHERSLQNRRAALIQHSRIADPSAATAPAREAARRRLVEKFENEVDPDRVLDPAERERRASYARKAYFAGLALKSAQTRRQNRATAAAAAQAAELDVLLDADGDVLPESAA